VMALLKDFECNAIDWDKVGRVCCVCMCVCVCVCVCVLCVCMCVCV